jgi:hypothetical protein
MKLIRFRDPDGKIAWGEQLSDGSARVLTSGIYQPWTFSDEVRSVAALLAPIEPTNISASGGTMPRTLPRPAPIGLNARWCS